MANEIDWSDCKVVERVSDGRWTVRRTDVLANEVVSLSDAGCTTDEIVDLYDGLSVEDAKAIIGYAGADQLAAQIAAREHARDPRNRVELSARTTELFLAWVRRASREAHEVTARRGQPTRADHQVHVACRSCVYRGLPPGHNRPSDIGGCCSKAAPRDVSKSAE
jgi:uncharacterized protein (DUF433 family)